MISRPSIGWLRRVGLGDDGLGEPELGRLAQPLLPARRRAHFAGQPHLAEHHQAARQRPVAQRRTDRQQHRQIGRGLADAHAADRIDEHVLVEASRRPRGGAAPPAAWPAAAAPGRPTGGAGWARAPRRPAPGSPPAAAACPPASPARTSPAPASAVDPRCDRNSAEGLATPFRPRSVMANTPSSLTAPKRFLIARTRRKLEWVSPSKYSTVSTMCSSTRGPASAPSLVTWPTSTMNDAALLGKARQLRRAFAHLRNRSRRRSSCAEYSVWIESITTTRGRSRSIAARMRSRSISLASAAAARRVPRYPGAARAGPPGPPIPRR